MKLNGAAILIECLIEQGVGTVFGFPGGAVLPIYDELYKRQDRINHVLTAHEQHAGHAADGYARASGRTGVCIATSGPGATNLVTPIATAYMDSSPVVFITGNVPQSLMGTDSFQEADISGMTMPVTKHNYLVTRVDKLADTVREAFYIAASGRPGPVLIDVPKDVQIAETEYEPASGEALIPRLSLKNPMAQLRPEGEALERYKLKAEPRLERAAQLIAEAHRPLIYCGGGVVLSGAQNELLALAERVDAPVEVEQLAEDDAEHHGKDGDECIAAREHAVETDVEHAQGDALFNGGVEALGDEAPERHADEAAGEDGEHIDKASEQHHLTSSFARRARSSTASPPIISPPQPGTQVRLAGTLRRPGGGVSFCSVVAGSSGEKSTRVCRMPRALSSFRITRASGQP